MKPAAWLHWYATATDIDDRKRDETESRSENLALREEIDRSSMFEEIVGSSLRAEARFAAWSREWPPSIDGYYRGRDWHRQGAHCARDS